MKIKLFLVIVALAATAHAQPKSQSQSPAQPDEQQQAARNDDAGRALVITSVATPLAQPSKPNAPLISEPQQYSIFLGSGWARKDLRGRETTLANLLANIGDQATLNTLSEAGVKNLFGATFSQEKLNDLDGHVSDLQIQAVLGAMLRDGSLGGPNPNTIYVVFLGPGLESTLGSMIGRKHYLAYHNFFNAQRMKLHYVVVPFEPDANAAQNIATRAFLTAVGNP